MRTTAFGYSTQCNIKCEHCVAADDTQKSEKMELPRAKELITQLDTAQVQGISFTAGEPFIFFDDITELIKLCKRYAIYSRIVTNSFWAKSPERAEGTIIQLKENGLSQLRLSYSRWHQKNVKQQNILNAAKCCEKIGLDYFISFVTDFSKEDDAYENFLRIHKLRFFPEPVIFSGRAKSFEHAPLRTDYQENRCPMNPYIAPNLDMYACCDAGSHFTKTNFFHLGNLQDTAARELFRKSETNVLYNHIRTLGITAIASFAGFRASDIIGYRKCELCELLFNSPNTLEMLQKEAASGLQSWHR